MKKLFFTMLIPLTIFAGAPKIYDSTDDLAKLDNISNSLDTIKNALTKCITKLQECAKANNLNIAEIGKTSSKISDVDTSFDATLKLANQASNIVDQMTQREELVK